MTALPTRPLPLRSHRGRVQSTPSAWALWGGSNKGKPHRPRWRELQFPSHSRHSRCLPCPQGATSAPPLHRPSLLSFFLPFISSFRSTCYGRGVFHALGYSGEIKDPSSQGHRKNTDVMVGATCAEKGSRGSCFLQSSRGCPLQADPRMGTRIPDYSERWFQEAEEVFTVPTMARKAGMFSTHLCPGGTKLPHCEAALPWSL